MRAVGVRKRLEPALRRLALWRIDHELDVYLSAQFSRCWPTLRIERYQNADPLARLRPDLWICGEEPPNRPRVPTLVLTSIHRTTAQPVADGLLWRVPMPCTGLRLIRLARSVLVDGST